MKSKELLVFTATYNEKDNVQALCERILEAAPGADILIVDDNSPDGTGELLDKLAKKLKNLRVIHRSGKLGLGSAHRLGFKHAVEGGYQYLITMDADFSHDPDDIPRFIEALHDNDFIIGSRFSKGGKSDYVGYRSVISSLGNWAAKRLLGTKVNELTTSYRAFRTSIFGKFKIDLVKSEGYSFFMECLFHISHLGFRYDEIPIHFKNREYGVSKIPKMQILYSLLSLIRLFFRGRIIKARALLMRKSATAK